MHIITLPDGSVPELLNGTQNMCISCGQCDSFCPTRALTRDGSSDGTENLSADLKTIQPESLGRYLKSRRSIRTYHPDPVDRKTIIEILDVARYAASGGNSQSTAWHVILNKKKVNEISSLIIEWLRSLIGTNHPMNGYAPGLVQGYDNGIDVICRGAPHLLIAHVPEDNPIAPVDGIIALTHVDILAPAFGIGTCWAGFVMIAAAQDKKVREALGLPPGRIPAYALMFGYPKYKPTTIPERKPAVISWDE
jgi:nitroreductase